MPVNRQHRGPHPEDARLFAPDQVPRLRRATDDLSLLLTRGYAEPSALKLVGDRYNLTARQRIAVARCACTDAALASRGARRIDPAAARGRPLLIDGFNLVTTVEAALAGGVLIRGRDGCVRDMASMHGNYRKVQETGPAIEAVGAALAGVGAEPVVWYLDRPVSNSGRLKAAIEAAAAARNWPWRGELVPDPDPLLAASGEAVATADSGVLDRCERWLDLASLVIARLPQAPPVVALGSP